MVVLLAIEDELRGSIDRQKQSLNQFPHVFFSLAFGCDMVRKIAWPKWSVHRDVKVKRGSCEVPLRAKMCNALVG